MPDNEQLCYFLSVVMRRIHGIPLDKDAKPSFIKRSPEKHAENLDNGLRETAKQTENSLWRQSKSSPSSPPQ